MKHKGERHWRSRQATQVARCYLGRAQAVRPRRQQDAVVALHRRGGLEAKIAQRQGCPVDRVPGLKYSVFEMYTGSTGQPAVYGI